MPNMFVKGDKVKLVQGNVTWHGVIHRVIEPGPMAKRYVVVQWSTMVRERIDPDELERDDDDAG